MQYDGRLNLLYELQLGRVSARTFRRTQMADKMVDLQLSKHLDVEQCHRSPVSMLHLDRIEGRYLLSAGASGQIFVHDTHDVDSGTMKVACRIDKNNRHCHEFSVESVQWYPLDTGIFSSSGMDFCFKLWDTNRLRPIFLQRMEKRIYRHHVSSLNCQMVLFATEHPYAQIMDLRVGTKIHQLSGAHRGSLTTVAWSPSCENICATGGRDGKCVLWDIRYSRGHLASLDAYSDGKGKDAHRKAHEGRLVSFEFTPDGGEMVTFGEDCAVRLWDVALAKNRHINFGRVNCRSLKGVKMALTTDTSPPMLMVPCEQVVKVFDLTSGQKLVELTGHFNSVNAVEYCPSSGRVYSAGSDRNILVWTSSDGPEEQDLDRSVAGPTSDHDRDRDVPPSIMDDAWSSDDDEGSGDFAFNE